MLGMVIERQEHAYSGVILTDLLLLMTGTTLLLDELDILAVDSCLKAILKQGSQDVVGMRGAFRWLPYVQSPYRPSIDELPFWDKLVSLSATSP